MSSVGQCSTESSFAKLFLLDKLHFAIFWLVSVEYSVSTKKTLCKKPNAVSVKHWTIGESKIRSVNVLSLFPPPLIAMNIRDCGTGQFPSPSLFPSFSSCPGSRPINHGGHYENLGVTYERTACPPPPTTVYLRSKIQYGTGVFIICLDWKFFAF